MSIDRASRQPIAGGHYAVVCGLNMRNIVLQDPAVGHPLTLTRRHFFNVWFDFTYVYPRVRDDLIIRRLIVIVPREFAAAE